MVRKTHCLKCKCSTDLDEEDELYKMNKIGRYIGMSSCPDCGHVKCRLVAKDELETDSE